MSLDAIKAARAYVETFFDDGAAKGLQQLERHLDKFGTKLQGYGTQMIKLAAPIVGFGGLAVASFTHAGSALDDMAQRTSIGVSTLSELAHAAQMSGTSIDALESGLVKQTKFLGDVFTNGKAAAGTLYQLGLSASDLEGLSPEDTLGVFAEALSGVEDDVTRTNLAMDIFGKGATELLPLLNSGAGGIEQLRKEARDLGIVMSDDDAAAAASFGDQLDSLWAQLGAATNQVGAALVPALSELLTTITPLLTTGIDWLAQNDELIVTIGAVATGILTGGSALVGFGFATSAAATGLGGVVAVGSALAGVLGFLLTPLGAITAGIVTLVATTVDWGAGWQYLVDTLGESLSLASQLLMNGEINLAMELVWAQIEALWTRGVRWMVEQTGAFVTATVGVLAAGIDKLATLLDAMRNSLARQIAAAGEFTGLLPEGTSAELASMQRAGQVGTSVLHDLAKSVSAAGQQFQQLGSNVQDVEARLASLKRQAIDTTIRTQLAKDMQASGAPVTNAQRRQTPLPRVDYTDGAMSGTFSGQASRMFFSMGESKTVAAINQTTEAIKDQTKMISRNPLWGKVGP